MELRHGVAGPCQSPALRVESGGALSLLVSTEEEYLGRKEEA